MMKYGEGDVWRITVDERLDEKIVRFLVAEMKKAVDIGVLINEEIWGEEEEFIITSARQERVIHSFDIEGLVPIPNAAYEIFKTENGNPVIFVKFPLHHSPDSIVGFDVINVKSKRR